MKKFELPMPNYSERHRQLFLVLIMTIVGFIIGGVTLAILYETSMEQTRQRLQEIVQSHARLIEAIAREGLRHLDNADKPDASHRLLEKILGQLQEAQQKFPGLGNSGEFVLARREGDQISFLLLRRHDKTDQPIPVPYHSFYAEPMRRAVDGGSGVMIGLDYRGEIVMAAYDPVQFLNVGFVAKIDLSELRRPFILASGVALGCGVLVILLGTFFFFRVSEPLLRQAQETALLREQRQHLEETREELKEKAIYLDNIINSATDMAIIATDATLVIKYCNSTTEIIHNIKVEEVIGRKVQEIHQRRGEDPLCFEHSIAEVLAHGVHCHELYNTIGGGEFILESQISAITDPVKGLVGFLLIDRDVTAKYQAQEALIRSEKRYRRLMESANDAIIVADADTGIILEANHMAGKLLNRDVYEIIGMHQTMLHPPEEIDYYAQLFREHVQGLRDSIEDIVVMRSDGNRVAVDVRATVTDLGEQRVIQGIFRDVTDRKKAQKILQINQQRLATAQMIAHLGNWDWDFHTNCLEWSDEAYRIFGYEPQSWTPTFDEFLKAVHPQDRLLVDTAIHQTLAKPYPPYNIEYRIIRPDGTEAYVHQQGALFLGEEQMPKRFVGTVQDVTVRKAMEIRLQNLNQELEDRVTQRTQELERSNWDLQQFAYVASHDLKEPLRLVAGFAQLLEKRYSGMLDDKATQYITYVVDGVKQMDRLIDSLLSYARAGSQSTSMNDINIEVVLNRVLRYLGHIINETGAVITSDLLPRVVADEGQLIQVFQNLLGNAVKFHSDLPPAIHVSCRQMEKEWLFSIKDNGIGIDIQYAERIFVIFQKLHARSRYEGTGIGLALCKRIIERHGGRIWVESTLGIGSTFFFTLPMTS